jgi:hypothetical protein
MNVFELFAVLTLQKDDYNKGLDETEGKASGWGDKIKGIMQNKAVAAFMLVGKAVAEVGKKLNQLMLDTMNYADTVGDLAAQYGVSTDAISEMQYIADQSSTSVEQLTTSMSMLYMRAKQDGDAFKQLGVSVKDNEGNFKSMDELFWETAEALNGLEDDGAKSAYMLDLFGRSAMNVGEVLRKSSGEITAMRQEAHDLGIVMEEDTINFASDMNDKMAVLKLQGQSALAMLVAGEEGAEEKVQQFLDDLLELLDAYIPAFVNFVVRLAIQATIGLIRILPTLVVDVLTTFIDVIFSINWIQVGIDIGKAIVEGLINMLILPFKWIASIFGIKIPRVKIFGETDKSDYFTEDTTVENDYELKSSTKQDININIEASGDTPVSEETAEKTAEKLAPYIDKILGGK